jgi:[ribosomal protein S5]-alanine N-acetyltransferase
MLERGALIGIVACITEETFIDFSCPHCGGVASFPVADVGYVRACPTCFGDVIVPSDGSGSGQALPLPLTLERLTLRRFVPADWHGLMACVPDSEEESILRWIESDSHVRLTTPGQPFCLGIELREAGKLVGYLSLSFTDGERLQAMLSFHLHPEYQQQDLLVEAVDGTLGFCFDGIKLHRITAQCSSADTMSSQAFEAAGLRQEAEFVKDTRGPEGWLNSIWFALLEEEYLARAPASG